jgi:hypothetical protein
MVTVVAQWAKAPGIHCYVAGSIPAVTPRYCTKKIGKCSLEHKKKTKEKKGMQCDTTFPERALFRFVCEFISSSQEPSQGGGT